MPGNLSDEGLLAVLRLEHTNLTTSRIEHHAALGQTGETSHFIERDGGLLVGVQHAPDPRRHTNDQSRQQESRQKHGDDESQRPHC